MRKKKKRPFPLIFFTLTILFLSVLSMKNTRSIPGSPMFIQQIKEFSLLPVAMVAGLLDTTPQTPAKTVKEEENITYPVSKLPMVAKPGHKSLTLGWIFDTGPSDVAQVLNSTPGLDVLSPKWFHVDGPNGAIAGTADPAIVKLVHNSHEQIWAIIDNGFNGPLSHAILQYQDKQDKLIAHITNLAVSAHLDGINLDFEGLETTDRWNYSRFVAVLANSLHRHGISLSVDLPPDLVPGKNTGPYNHAALAKAADYLVLMGYDEHWQGDTEAGPTASLPWVKAAIKDFLDTGVPAQKLILGIPFYTQNWTVSKDGKVLSSEALSLYQSNQLVTSTNANIIWKPKEGVYYTTFNNHGEQQEMWLEDPRTLMLLSQMARNQQLAGIAAWYLGLESPSTWLSVVNTLESPKVSY